MATEEIQAPHADFTDENRVDVGKQGKFFFAVLVVFFGVFGLVCNTATYGADGKQIPLSEFDATVVVWTYKAFPSAYFLPPVLLFLVCAFLTYSEDLPHYGAKNSLWLVPITALISFGWFWAIEGLSLDPLVLLLGTAQGWFNLFVLFATNGLGSLFGWRLKVAALLRRRRAELKAAESPTPFANAPETSDAVLGGGD
ncbi:MAG: hypothetical protein Kow0069_09690 [Promethearchaeota archaeon]